VPSFNPLGKLLIEEAEMRDGINSLQQFSMKEIIDKAMLENYDYE